MGSIIRTSGAIYSLSYFNSRIGFHGPKYLYSLVSVIDTRLPVNTKKWAIAPFVDDQSATFRILGGYEPCATWILHMVGMHHQYVWHDSSDRSWHQNRLARVMSCESCVTWLLRLCNKPHSHVCHDSRNHSGHRHNLLNILFFSKTTFRFAPALNRLCMS